MKTILIALITMVLSACGDSNPPVIDTKKASDTELNSYIAQNCQDKFKMHPFCIDASNEKTQRTSDAMLKKKGVITNMRSAEEVFGKPQKK